MAQPPATEPRRGPAWSKLSAPTLRADRHHSPRPGPHWGGRSLCSRQEQRLEFFLVIQTNCKHFYSFLGPYINSCGAASAPGRRPAVHGGARRPAPARSLTPLCRRSPLASRRPARTKTSQQPTSTEPTPGTRPASAALQVELHRNARRCQPARAGTVSHSSAITPGSPLCSPLTHESSVPALAPRPLGQAIRQGGGSIPKRPLLEDRQRLR